MKKLTQAQIKKLPVKNLTADQFIKLASKIAPGMPLSRMKVLEVGHGGFLGVYGNKEKFYKIHLKSIWIKPFDMKYSAHANTRSGKEILISNFPLPDGPVINPN